MGLERFLSTALVPGLVKKATPSFIPIFIYCPPELFGSLFSAMEYFYGLFSDENVNDRISCFSEHLGFGHANKHFVFDEVQCFGSWSTENASHPSILSSSLFHPSE
ncbi:MAG: hypothetical protein ACLQMF_10475 [Rectinemataceae bacterium]